MNRTALHNGRLTTLTVGLRGQRTRIRHSTQHLMRQHVQRHRQLNVTTNRVLKGVRTIMNARQLLTRSIRPVIHRHSTLSRLFSAVVSSRTVTSRSRHLRFIRHNGVKVRGGRPYATGRNSGDGGGHLGPYNSEHLYLFFYNIIVERLYLLRQYYPQPINRSVFISQKNCPAHVHGKFT